MTPFTSKASCEAKDVSLMVKKIDNLENEVKTVTEFVRSKIKDAG